MQRFPDFMPDVLFLDCGKTSLLSHLIIFNFSASSTAIFTPSAVTTSVYPSQVDADVAPLRHLRLPAHSLPNVGLTRFKPSPDVVKLGPSPVGVVPASSLQTSQRPVPSVVAEKPVATAFKSSPSKQVVPVGPSRPRSSGKGR